jgi:hypothetical protein
VILRLVLRLCIVDMSGGKWIDLRVGALLSQGGGHRDASGPVSYERTEQCESQSSASRSVVNGPRARSKRPSASSIWKDWSITRSLKKRRRMQKSEVTDGGVG